MPFMSQLIPIDALVPDPYMEGVLYAILILISSIIACVSSVALIAVYKKLVFKLMFLFVTLISMAYTVFAMSIQPIILEESNIQSPDRKAVVRVLWEERAGGYTTFVLIKMGFGYKAVFSENGALPISVKWLDNNQFSILDSNTGLMIHKIDLRNIRPYHSELKLNEETFRRHLNKKIEMLKH